MQKNVTPLKHRSAVNRPFRSPMSTVPSTDGEKQSIEKRRQTLGSKLSPKAVTPKRPRDELYQPIKKFCLKKGAEIEQRECSKDELEALRERIRVKQLQVDQLKIKMQHNRKHQSRDLEGITKRWLQGCQNALERFHKDLQAQGNNTMSMIDVLSQLAIPPELVQYSVEDCDFT